jgi:outer membrane protein assembly factor BamA
MLKGGLVFVLYFFIVALHAQSQNVVYDLKIRGNKKLKTSFVRKISDTKAGGVLDSTLIERDILRLKRLPSVAHAYYQVFHSEGNKYNVFYDIQENFTIIPLVNVFTTNDDEFAYRLGVSEFNFLGRNITIGGFFQRDIYNSYAFNLRAPFLISNGIGLSLSYQNLTTLEPVFFDGGSADYKYNNTSYEALGLFQFDFKNRIELGLTFFIEDYEKRTDLVLPGIPTELVADKWLIKSIYEFNNLDFDFHFVSGFKALFNFQYVTSTEEILPDFFIGWGDFFYFKKYGEKGNWASRLRMGLSTNADSPFAPFSVDNNLNVRGVGNIIDRGTGVIVLNTEYRHTLVDKDWFLLQGNAFIDGGTWRNPGGRLGDFGDSQNIRIYPGLGFRFIHKKIYNATFRVDYGVGVTKDSTQGFVFGIGQYF